MTTGRTAWLFMLALLTFVPGIASSQVKVRLEPPKRFAEIKGFSLRIAAKGEVRSLRRLPTRDALIITVHQNDWRVETRKGEVFKFRAPELRIEGEMLSLRGEEVPNNVILYPVNGRRIEVITEVDLDTYLKGVIPSEMPATWPLEALKAQAVAARSYALHTIAERKDRRYHLDSSTNHQVFKLINFLSAPGAVRDQISRAVDETRGQILVREISGMTASADDVLRVRPFKAYYHANCGGMTEEPSAVWGGNEPQQGIVQDATCARHSEWTARLSQKDAREKLGHVFKSVNSNAPLDIQIARYSPTGRVQELKLIFGKESKIVSSQKLREWLGYGFIKSAHFELIRTDAGFVFKGRGHGHGVGMCQHGARMMALNGADYRAILRRYYPSARLVENEPLKKTAFFENGLSRSSVGSRTF